MQQIQDQDGGFIDRRLSGGNDGGSALYGWFFYALAFAGLRRSPTCYFGSAGGDANPSPTQGKPVSGACGFGYVISRLGPGARREEDDRAAPRHLPQFLFCPNEPRPGIRKRTARFLAQRQQDCPRAISGAA